MVEEGFLEERTLDLHFGRWVGVSLLERKEEQSEQKPRQEITLCFGSRQSSLWTEGSGEGKAGLEEKKSLGSYPLPPPKYSPQSQASEPPALPTVLSAPRAQGLVWGNS